MLWEAVKQRQLDRCVALGVYAVAKRELTNQYVAQSTEPSARQIGDAVWDFATYVYTIINPAGDMKKIPSSLRYLC